MSFFAETFSSCSRMYWHMVREASDEALGTEQSILQVQIEEAGYKEGEATIRNITFAVDRHEMVGLIGPNGAGKSTTIKSILKLMPYVKGTVRIGGMRGAGGTEDSGAPGGPASRYAYVPEQPIYYEYMTLWEHLQLAAAAFDIPEERFAVRAEELLARFRMREVKHHYPTSFSKGMKQKLMLLIGFVLEPELYIVDEPFVGLDPRATQDFLELLKVEQERGAGVLLCTHVLDTAERICNRFVMLHQGGIVAEGTLDDVRRAANYPERGTLFECFLEMTPYASNEAEGHDSYLFDYKADIR